MTRKVYVHAVAACDDFGPMPASDLFYAQRRALPSALDVPEGLVRGEALALTCAKRLLAPFEAVRETILASCDVVLGNSTSGLNEAAALAAANADDEDVAKALDLGRPSAAVAQGLGTTGLDLTISTACTAGAKALIEAARRIRSGACEYAIAGGLDVANPFTSAGFEALGAAGVKPCRPFSATRTGLHLGEGGALFLLSDKPELAGKPAMCELAGTGESADAHHISAPHPEGDGAVAAMQLAMKTAGVSPKDVELVVVHGTATAQNDIMEAKALSRVFGHTGRAIRVAALKRRLGHQLAGAGPSNAAFACASLASLNPTPVPESLADGDKLDPAIKALGVEIYRDESAPCEFGLPTLPFKTILVNAFAFGGSCASLLFKRTRYVDRLLPTPDELLMQAPPMRFVERTLAITTHEGPEGPCGAASLFTPGADHILVSAAGFPSTALIETMAQTIGLYAGAVMREKGEPPRIGLLLGSRKAKFAKAFFPPESTFVTRVREVFRSDEGLWQFDCRVSTLEDGVEIDAAQALLTVYQPSVDEDLPF